MKISIIGTGYVGLVTGVILADKGHGITCVDIDEERVKDINNGKPPIYEKGLEPMLGKAIEKGNLRATTDLENSIQHTDMSLICVGTPTGSFDYIDLRYVKEASRSIGKALRKVDSYHIVTLKSTVVPGTTEHVVAPILEKESGKKIGKDFGLAMLPEFLREGNAIHDSLNPDRVVIGSFDSRSEEVIKGLYEDFKDKQLTTNPRTAEMIKYASNAFLATKISFINDMGNICKQLGIDVYEIAEGMGMDSRISPHFLNAGIGFGGSCFPKDVEAIVGKANEVYYRPYILNAALQLNEMQPLKMVELLEGKAGPLKGKDVVVLGLAFKPGTSDMRESPAIKIVNTLLLKGAIVHAVDPQATDEAEEIFGRRENLKLYKDPSKAVSKGKYLLIVSDWEDFKNEELYKGKTVVDGRRIEEAGKAKHYEGVCW